MSLVDELCIQAYRVTEHTSCCYVQSDQSHCQTSNSFNTSTLVIATLVGHVPYTNTTGLGVPLTNLQLLR